jgi:hypothetical protein
MYTGRIVPEGMAGSSVDQSNIPQPKPRVQEEQRTMISAAGRNPKKRPFFPGTKGFIFKKVYLNPPEKTRSGALREDPALTRSARPV